MIRTTIAVFAAMAVLLLAACGRTPPSEQRGDGRLVGLLHHSPGRECPSRGYCGPEFSLLNETLDEWAPLEGDLDPAHHGLVISIEGRVKSIDDDDREWFGTVAAPYAVGVKRYRLLSEIPYHEFLVEQASEFTTRKYGCDLLWDKSFRWEQVDGRIHLVVRMTDSLGGTGPRPWVELTYDGTTGHFLSEEMEPWGVNPCG